MKLAALQRNNTGQPHAPAVILLHGVFGRGRNLGMIQRALSHHANTIALDLRSHGDSPHGPLSYPAMAQDVLETLDDLGLKTATLLGHSMGGKVAMTTALLAPERVTRLLIADIAPAPMNHGQNALAQTLSTLRLPPLHSRAEIRRFLAPVITQAETADLIGQNIALSAPSSNQPAQWTIGLHEIAESFPTIEGWPDFPPGTSWNGPALFLRGETSPYIRPEHHSTIHRLFPQSRIETIPQAGHWLHIDRPILFQEAVLRFLGF